MDNKLETNYNNSDFFQLIHKINNPLAIIAAKTEYLMYRIQKNEENHLANDIKKVTHDLETIHKLTFQICDLLTQLRNSQQTHLQPATNNKKIDFIE